MKITKQSFIEEFEQHMLLALDDFIEKDEVAGIGLGNAGWKDEDLPIFLPSLRKHAENLYNRFYNEETKNENSAKNSHRYLPQGS